MVNRPVQTWWERMEEPAFQWWASLAFTFGIHGFLALLLVAQINWQLSEVSPPPIGIVFAEEMIPITPQRVEPEPTPVVELPLKGSLSLPSVTPEDKKSPKPKPEPKPKEEKKAEPKPLPTPPPPPKPTPKNEEDQLSAIIARSIQPSAEAPSPTTSASTPTANVGAPTGQGGGAQGEGRGDIESQLATELYVGNIKSAIRARINYPEGLNQNPKTILLIRQNQKGEILSVRVSQSSGIPSFDEAIVRAVYAAGPLPLPPSQVRFEPEIKLEWRRYE